MLSEVLRQIETQRQASRSGLADEKTRLEAELKQISAEIGRTSKLAGGRGAQAKTAADRLAQLHARVAELEGRLHKIRHELDAATLRPTDPGELKQALEKFELLWEHMTTWEQEKFIRALVKEVRYDGRTGAVTLSFHSSAIRELCSGGVPAAEEKQDARRRG